jgi:hypothetical protein
MLPLRNVSREVVLLQEENIRTVDRESQIEGSPSIERSSTVSCRRFPVLDATNCLDAIVQCHFFHNPDPVPFAQSKAQTVQLPLPKPSRSLLQKLQFMRSASRSRSV